MRLFNRFIIFLIFIMSLFVFAGCGDNGGSGGNNSGGGIVDNGNGGGNGNEAPVKDIDLEKDPTSLIGVYIIDSYKFGENGEELTPTTNKEFRVGANLSSDFQNISIPISIKLESFPVVLISIEKPIDYSNLNAFIAETFSSLGASVIDTKTLQFTMSSETFPEIVTNGIIEEGGTLILKLVKVKDLALNGGIEDPKDIPISKITLPESSTIDVLKKPKYQIIPVIEPIDATNTALKYISSNINIAEVNEIGMVTAKNKGEAVVTVSSSNGKITTSMKIMVTDTTVRVTGVTLSHTSVILNISDILQLEANIAPANADNKNKTFKSSNDNVATVDASGKVRAIGEGSVSITVTTEDGEKKAECLITVSKTNVPTTDINGIPATLEMEVSSTNQLTPSVVPSNATNKTITYSSSDNNIVSVSSNGLVTAVSTGSATVTATTADSVMKQISITVKQTVTNIPVNSVTLNQTLVNVERNTEFNLTATVSPANATDKTLTVSATPNANVTITPNGESNWKITTSGSSLDNEKITVTVTSSNGLTATLILTSYLPMKLDGTYNVETLKILTKGGDTKTFNSINSKLDGEAAIKVENSKINVTGRFQFTPQQLSNDYKFNDFRYNFVNKDVNISENIDLSKTGLAIKNIEIVDSTTLKYSYDTDNGAVEVTLKKFGEYKSAIEDKYIYITPIDVDNDPKSIEGHYAVTYFYSSPIQPTAQLYGSVASDCSDVPSGAISCKNGFICGGSGKWCGYGPNGAVRSFVGELTAKVNQDNTFSVVSKMQMDGHKALDMANDDKYSYTVYAPIPVKVEGGNGIKLSSDDTNKGVSGVNNNSSTTNADSIFDFQKGKNDSTLNTYLKLENKIALGMEIDVHIYTYATKLSDKPVTLSMDKFPDFPSTVITDNHNKETLRSDATWRPILTPIY